MIAVCVKANNFSLFFIFFLFFPPLLPTFLHHFKHSAQYQFLTPVILLVHITYFPSLLFLWITKLNFRINCRGSWPALRFWASPKAVEISRSLPGFHKQCKYCIHVQCVLCAHSFRVLVLIFASSHIFTPPPFLPFISPLYVYTIITHQTDHSPIRRRVHRVLRWHRLCYEGIRIPPCLSIRPLKGPVPTL